MQENWKIGKHPSEVVSDKKIRNTNFPCPPNKEETDDSDVEHYGGHLVCESVGNINHANLIAAAPEMSRTLQKIANWELPETGRFWDNDKKEPMSYEACWGSQGVRDYFKSLAEKAIKSIGNNQAPTTKAPTISPLMEAAPDLLKYSKKVMDLLEEHGGSIVPHLIDDDANDGERLRQAIKRAEA